jgi:hypothetical protein
MQRLYYYFLTISKLLNRDTLTLTTNHHQMRSKHPSKKERSTKIELYQEYVFTVSNWFLDSLTLRN